MQDQKESSYIDLLSESLVFNLDGQKCILTQLLKQAFWRGDFQERFLNSISEKHLKKSKYK